MKKKTDLQSPKIAVGLKTSTHKLRPISKIITNKPTIIGYAKMDQAITLLRDHEKDSMKGPDNFEFNLSKKRFTEDQSNGFTKNISFQGEDPKRGLVQYNEFEIVRSKLECDPTIVSPTDIRPGYVFTSNQVINGDFDSRFMNQAANLKLRNNVLIESDLSGDIAEELNPSVKDIGDFVRQCDLEASNLGLNPSLATTKMEYLDSSTAMSAYIGASYNGNFGLSSVSVDSRLQIDKEQSSGAFVCKVEKIYYTLKATPIQGTVWKKGCSLNKKEMLDRTLMVSKVDYGYRFYIIIKTEFSRSELEAELNFEFNSISHNVDIEAKLSKLNQRSNLQVEIVSAGGFETGLASTKALSQLKGNLSGNTPKINLQDCAESIMNELDKLRLRDRKKLRFVPLYATFHDAGDQKVGFSGAGESEKTLFPRQEKGYDLEITLDSIYLSQAKVGNEDSIDSQLVGSVIEEKPSKSRQIICKTSSPKRGYCDVTIRNTGGRFKSVFRKGPMAGFEKRFKETFVFLFTSRENKVWLHKHQPHKVMRSINFRLSDVFNLDDKSIILNLMTRFINIEDGGQYQYGFKPKDQSDYKRVNLNEAIRRLVFGGDPTGSWQCQDAIKKIDSTAEGLITKHLKFKDFCITTNGVSEYLQWFFIHEKTDNSDRPQQIYLLQRYGNRKFSKVWTLFKIQLLKTEER